MIKKGDQSALGTLYDAYSGALYNVVLKIVQSKEDADELIQSVFLKVWNNIDSFDNNKSSIYTWMATIAKNSALDKLRSKSFKNDRKNTSFSLSDYGLKTSSKYKGLDIDQLTKNMDSKYKFLIEKFYMEGYTQQEISDEFDIPLGTIKTRLREAINMLRETLKDEKHLLYFLSLI
ncbi:MAG: Sigma-K factor [Bacteroidota bacterium]